jgi:glycosyltransferase involved in cell wall biosynthesis
MSVSIIIPNFNKVDFIKETIDSLVVNLTEGIEWIIVDDGSTDGSLELLENLSKKHDQLQLFSNPGKGGSSARNYGASRAKGEFLIFLDSDDLISQDCIFNRIEATSAYPENDLWVFPMGVFLEKPGDLPRSYNWIPNETRMLSRFLSHQLPWAICQPIWRKSLFEKIGGFDERFPRLQDVELHTKALLKGAKVKCFPNAEPDCFYRTSANRISFSAESFQKKFIDGAVLYYETFFIQLNKQQQKYLSGTLLETLSVLVYQLRQGNISKSDFQVHRDKLIATCKFSGQKNLLKSYAALQSASTIHIKGLKRITRSLLFL